MRILIGYDGSESADAALDELSRAGLPGEGQALVVTVGDVLVAPPEPSYEAAIPALAGRRGRAALTMASVRAAEALREAEEQASRAGARLRSLFPGWEVSTEGTPGAPAWTLLERAAEWGADLMVVGSRGRSPLGRLLLGSVSRTVAAEAGCSVRIVRRRAAGGGDTPTRIVVGVDGSSEAERAVRAVGERVWPGGTEVRIIAVDDGVSPAGVALALPSAASAVAEFNEERAVRAHAMCEWAADELRTVGLDASVSILKGDPRRVLVEEARKWGADCVFVGPRRFRGLFERLRLGSVSTAVATDAHCSVEIAR